MPLLRSVLVLALLALPGAAPAQRPGAALPAFGSDRALGAFLRRRAERRDSALAARRRDCVARAAGCSLVGYAMAAADAGTPLPAMASPAMPAPAAAPAKLARAAGAGSASITNTQVEGVDEGDIVKRDGDWLVVLRRGRLFTIDVADGALAPTDAVDAFGPGVDPAGTWYDELITWRDRVVVIGFSYQRGGTELGVFRLDADGTLHHLDTYQLRSSDYYSSRNYASRLIGSRLVFYAPLSPGAGGADPLRDLPAMRRWRGQAGDSGFRRIAPPQRVHYPPWETDAEEALTMHTVTTCDLAAPTLDCTATVVLGPPGHVFHVSSSAVYVWASEWRRGRDSSGAVLFRLPLDGSAPGALAVSGSPVDQFSFLESDDAHLAVLVRAEGTGDGMWRAERARGRVALLRVPLSAFGDGSRAAPAARYRPLPSAGDGALQNRFVGDWLLYGTGSGWGRPREDEAVLYAVPWRGGEVARLVLPHGIDRIEPMGADALVVGAAGRDLHFTGIHFDGDAPALRQRFVLADAAQGELRSHGFFYRPDADDAGVLGLPVRGGGRAGWTHLREGSAGVLFLRNAGGGLRSLGQLAAGSGEGRDDRCRASCVDWYGNARPIFLGGRVLALLGYELVEGRVDADGITEVRRVDFAPRALQARLLRRP